MAGESISMTARRAGSGGRAAIARLKATPRFVRSMEERITMPSSSMSRIVSSLQEYQSTILRRFSVVRSEEHTSELQSRFDLVCRLLLEKKKITYTIKL